MPDRLNVKKGDLVKLESKTDAWDTFHGAETEFIELVDGTVSCIHPTSKSREPVDCTNYNIIKCEEKEEN